MDVLVLCNMTFSSIHTSSGQLYHRLSILRFKDKLPILFKTPFDSMKLKGRLDTVRDYGIRTEITRPQRGKKTNPKQGKHTARGEYVKLPLDYKKYYEKQTLPVICKCIK